MRKLLTRAYDIAGAAAAAFVVAIFVTMVGSSALRQVGIATAGVDDLVSWMTAAAAFLGLAHTFRNGDLVRMTLMIDRATTGRRRVIEIAALAIGVVGTGYGAWWVVDSVIDSWRYQEMSTGLLVAPLWIPQLSFAAGALLLFVAFVDEFVSVLRGGTPSYVAAVEERHARGDYSQDV